MARKYRQLLESDRFQIQFLLAQGVSQNLIAKRIGFSASTVSHELARTRAHGMCLLNGFAFLGIDTQRAHPRRCSW